MEGFGKAPERRLLRCCERHRLEDHLLVLAYEQIRPVIRKRHGRTTAKHSQQRQETTRTRTPRIRSA